MLHLLHDIWQQWITVFTAGGMEGTGIPWPGGVIVAGAGVSSNGNWLSLLMLATVFSIAYCTGSLAQYAVGRFIGATALQWLPAAQRAKLSQVMEKYGPAAVLWSRPFAIGNYVSIPAGMARMPLPKFVLYTFLGVWPWAFSMILIGRLFGDRFANLKAIIDPYLLPSVLGLAVGAVAVMVWRVRRSRRHDTKVLAAEIGPHDSEVLEAEAPATSR